MEIRRRLKDKDNHMEKKEMEETDNQKNIDSEEVIPGLPPRKKVHKKRRSAFSLPSMKLGFPITLGLLLLVGGVWSLLGQDFSDNQTTMVDPVTAPEPKQVVIEEPKEKQTKPLVEAVHLEKTNSEPVHSALQPTAEQPAVKESKPVDKPPVYTKIMKHKVGVGETLYRISLAYYKTGKFATFLAKHNKLKNPTDLVSGSIIEVPFPPN